MLKNMVLITCFALALLASPSTSAREVTVPTQATVVIYLTLHTSLIKLQKVCGKNTVGCNKRWDNGTSQMHAMMPKNWCDANKVETLGHELLHSIGMFHSPNFKPFYLQPEAATGCRNGDWWSPLKNPRP